MDKKKLHQLQGVRLRECLEKSGFSQTEFCKRANNYNSSSLNQILDETKDRGIPDYLLSEWSEILGVDSGYFLVGEKIKSYEEYQSSIGIRRLVRDKWIEQNNFLQYADCKITNLNIVDDDKVVSYNVYNTVTGQRSEINAETMKGMKKQVADYIRYIVQNTMKGSDAP